MDSSTTIATENGLEDIQYLMHLEAFKRFTDDNNNVQRQVEEQTRNWLDAKCEYQIYYRRLFRIAKCCLLENAAAAAAQKSIAPDHVARTVSDVKKFASKISNDKQATLLDKNVMVECTANLATGHRARSLLSKQQRNCAENQETLKSVNASVELVENLLEAVTLQALDKPVSALPPRESTSKNFDSS